MKPFIEKEAGYILSKKRGDMLRKNAIHKYRITLTELWYLGVINMKEREALNLELDKMLYKEIFEK